MSLKSGWKRYRRKFSEQVDKHSTEIRTGYQVGGVVATSLLLGPAAGGAVAGSIAATRAANARKRAQESILAAASERAMAPAQFGRDVSAGGALGLELSPGMKSMIPVILIAGIILYMLFKD